jgi:hypothetical protein
MIVVAWVCALLAHAIGVAVASSDNREESVINLIVMFTGFISSMIPIALGITAYHGTMATVYIFVYVLVADAAMITYGVGVNPIIGAIRFLADPHRIKSFPAARLRKR